MAEKDGAGAEHRAGGHGTGTKQRAVAIEIGLSAEQGWKNLGFLHKKVLGF